MSKLSLCTQQNVSRIRISVFTKALQSHLPSQETHGQCKGQSLVVDPGVNQPHGKKELSNQFSDFPPHQVSPCWVGLFPLPLLEFYIHCLLTQYLRIKSTAQPIKSLSKLMFVQRLISTNLNEWQFYFPRFPTQILKVPFLDCPYTLLLDNSSFILHP